MNTINRSTPYGQLKQGNLLGQGWGTTQGEMLPMLTEAPVVLPEIPQVNPALAEGNWWDGVFSKTRIDPKTGATLQDQGWGMPAMGAAQGVFNAWLGMKQYGLAKQQLAEGKQQFGMNYDAQRSTTNAQLEDRQRARVASNAGAYQSVGDYMSNYGIKPRG